MSADIFPSRYVTNPTFRPLGAVTDPQGDKEDASHRHIVHSSGLVKLNLYYKFNFTKPELWTIKLKISQICLFKIQDIYAPKCTIFTSNVPKCGWDRAMPGHAGGAYSPRPPITAHSWIKQAGVGAAKT